MRAMGHDTTASVNISGTVYTAAAKVLFQAANSFNACKVWSTHRNALLFEPLVFERIVNGPASRNGVGTGNPNPEVHFDLCVATATPPGSISNARTEGM